MSETELQLLREQFAYNAWANAEVFGVASGVDRDKLEQEAPGTYGTIAETLKHLVGVEDAYLFMLRGQSPEQMGDREAYFQHDLAWFAGHQARLDDDYDDLLANAGADFLDGRLEIPWIPFPLNRRDGLLQILSHSAWHRAQVFSSLGERGVQVPDLDYVYFLAARRAPQSEETE